MDNKKTLILSILGVIILVIAVVGISYAMYSFTGTGSKENLITTGSVSLDITGGDTAENTIQLAAGYPEADNSSNHDSDTLEFSVKADLTGSTEVNYELGFVVTESTVPGGLKDEDVKFSLRKGDTYLLGTSATTGIKLSERAANQGAIKDTGGQIVIDSYFLDSDTLIGSSTFNYVVKAWISDDYNLPTTGTGSCEGTAPTNEAACEAIYGIWNGTTCALADRTSCEGAGGTWTDTASNVHSNETTASTLTFKVKVVAEG